MLYEVITVDEGVGLAHLGRRVADRDGDPGVGKTAIAEGLAQKVYNGEVPSMLADRITSYNVCYTKLLRSPLMSWQNWRRIP